MALSMGFEPTISALKGQRPKPLNDESMMEPGGVFPNQRAPDKDWFEARTTRVPMVEKLGVEPNGV